MTGGAGVGGGGRDEGRGDEELVLGLQRAVYRSPWTNGLLVLQNTHSELSLPRCYFYWFKALVTPTTSRRWLSSLEHNSGLVWLNLLNAELSLERYWRGPRSQEVVGLGGLYLTLHCHHPALF